MLLPSDRKTIERDPDDIARLAYYAIDPGAFDLVLPAWVDRLLHFVMFVLLFSAFTAILYNWLVISVPTSALVEDPISCPLFALGSFL